MIFPRACNFRACLCHANKHTQSSYSGKQIYDYAVISITRMFKRDDSRHVFLNQKTVYLPDMHLEGHTLLLPFLIDFTLIRGYFKMENPGTTPLVFVALLLLPMLPLLLTFIKFVDDDRLGERSHQLLAVNARATNVYI